MHSPKSVQIVIDIYTTKPYFKKTSRKHLRFSELLLNCTYSFLLYSFFYLMTSKKTSIQFAYLGTQIVCFLCLFAEANYDLNSNSVCSPRCSIHLVRKSSELQQEGYLLKMILQLIVSSCEIVSSIVFVIHYNPQLITGQLGS